MFLQLTALLGRWFLLQFTRMTFPAANNQQYSSSFLTGVEHRDGSPQANKKGYRGMKVPLRNVLNKEAACVGSIPGEMLSITSECHFSSSDVRPLTCCPCMTCVDCLRPVSWSLSSRKIKKQIHKLNTPWSFCTEMLDIYQKMKNGFQGHILIYIYIVIAQVGWLQSQTLFSTHGSSQRTGMKMEEDYVN